MKKSLILLVIVALVYSIIALFAVGCAKTNPVETPASYNVTPDIVVITPALAWWDMSDSLFYVQVNKTEVGTVSADTASLWITAFSGGVAYSTAYAGYKSGDWAWCLNDSFCVYQPADSVKLQLTWWIASGAKQTIDLWATVRSGQK